MGLNSSPLGRAHASINEREEKFWIVAKYLRLSHCKKTKKSRNKHAKVRTQMVGETCMLQGLTRGARREAEVDETRA